MFSRVVYVFLLLQFVQLELSAAPLVGDKLVKFFAYKESDRYFGVRPKDAKVVMIEYGSLTCYHCRAFFLNTLPELRQKYVDQEKKSLSIIHRLFVSDGPSMIAVALLECGKLDDKKYNKILANLYTTQLNWAYSSDVLNQLKGIFKSHGYSDELIEGCLQDKEKLKRITTEQQDIMEKGGLTGTPMIIINGVPLSDIRPSAIKTQLDIALE